MELMVILVYQSQYRRLREEARGKREEGRRKEGIYYLAASPAAPIKVIAGEQAMILVEIKQK